MPNPPNPLSSITFGQRSVVPSDRTAGSSLPGGQCQLDDPLYLARIGYVSRAWDLGRIRYASDAILRHVGEDFHQLVNGLLDGLLLSIKIVGGATAGGAALGGLAGAFVFGAGAAPGAAIGARLGFALGMAILEWLGVAFLMVYVATHLGSVAKKMQMGVERAWNSCGSTSAIDSAAREFADAIGILFSLILQAIIADLAKEMSGPAKGRLATAMEKLKQSRLFKRTKGLDEYLVKNYDRLHEEYSTSTNENTIRPDAPLPDISDNFKFNTEVRNGVTYKSAKGRLGVPGRILKHRDRYAQRKLSGGSGDHAGHLIAAEFGPKGGPENLSLQNWISNSKGTFRDLEIRWEKKLKSGSDIDVTVVDKTRPGETRPFVREVEWTETFPNGETQTTRDTFMNAHTPESRLKQNIPPTVTEPQTGNLYDFKTGKKIP